MSLKPIYLVGISYSKIFAFLKKYSRIWNYVEGSIYSFIIFLFLITNDRNSRKIIYCREFIICFWMILLVCPILNAKLITETHGFETEEPTKAKESWFQPLLKQMERIVFTKSYFIVCLTKTFMLKLHKKYHLYNKRIKIIPNAFDSKIFYPRDYNKTRKIVGFKKNKIYIVYSGLTFKYRNVERILDVAVRIKKQKKIIFVLIGGQPEEIKKLKEIAARLNLSTKIIFIGKVNQEMVSLYLNAADILIIPGALNEDIASPLKLFEYMRVKKPILCPNKPSFKEILSEKSAYFFKDNEDLIQQIIKIIENKKEVTKKSELSFKLSKKFSYKRRAKQIFNIFKKITAQLSYGEN
jgi:glycosyltransferase involved in cell wall biosynthesis